MPVVEMPLTLSILPVIVVVIFALLLCAAFTSRRDVHVAHNTLDGIATCLNPQGAVIDQILEERARANTRLVNAFHLTNTFVSKDSDVHSRFVNQAHDLLKQANRNGWRHFCNLSTQAVQVELNEVGQGKSVPYDRFVQAVCLRVILVGLLGVDASVDSFSSADINVVTNHINLLWSLSKTDDAIPPHLLPQLTSSLRRLVPDMDKYPNPIDFVIPAWETLWRVVATVVAHSCQDEDLIQAFSGLYCKPAVKTFNEANGRTSVRNVIAETMRLHPPSKRIGRVTLQPTATRLPRHIAKLLEKLPLACFLLRKESAEVHTMQVSEDIWGPDAAEFKPSRFAYTGSSPSRNTSDKAHQLLFGGGPLRCIGASWAPVAAGVMASAIISLILEQKEGSLTHGTVIGGRTGWDEWNVQGL